ncbi:hypothetical protein LTR78_000419 [Recurvomyces mirabilis]|uniref:magnesium chelatase n=1 Tax=Recurvomyces mirabilis TaxID=574656 RepID=A0AAE1C6K2_9PEZI|nr:hypothetical protein LTR78_000419 [Recurvomyces mirabilis]KAK5162074.1 hypothetical protein LTS14_000420 [Recurvomyces mirabilis]
MASIVDGRLQQLSDLDLAVLVSLASGQHCICSSPSHLGKDLRNELVLTCRETFGLQTAIINCSRKTTVDEFSEAILVESIDTFEDAEEGQDKANNHAGSPPRQNIRPSANPGKFSSLTNALDDRRIADVVIAMHLDVASESVQVQTLELLRTKRIFTRTAMHSAPRDFLLIVVASKRGARLSHHLNDMFGMSHFHGAEDGLPHLESREDVYSLPSFTRGELRTLQEQTVNVRLTGEVDAYLHNIVIFLRQSRYVNGGVTAAATRHLRAVAKALAPLHGLDYVPPSLVTLAAKKVYPHRLILATAETERTLRYGSDPDAIREVLRGITVEDVIEEVIAGVDTPL